MEGEDRKVLNNLSFVQTCQSQPIKMAWSPLHRRRLNPSRPVWSWEDAARQDRVIDLSQVVDIWRRICGNNLARPALWRTNVAEESGFHINRCFYTGAGDRREYG